MGTLNVNIRVSHVIRICFYLLSLIITLFFLHIFSILVTLCHPNVYKKNLNVLWLMEPACSTQRGYHISRNYIAAPTMILPTHKLRCCERHEWAGSGNNHSPSFSLLGKVLTESASEGQVGKQQPALLCSPGLLGYRVGQDNRQVRMPPLPRLTTDGWECPHMPLCHDLSHTGCPEQ